MSAIRRILFAIRNPARPTRQPGHGEGNQVARACGGEARAVFTAINDPLFVGLARSEEKNKTWTL
jgi:hypothetical protein